MKLKNRDFYKNMASIAVPIVIQNLITSSLNMVDTVMIGSLGKSNIAAVGLANQFFFLFVLLLFGINSGAAIFISQFWGKRDIVNIRKVQGIAILSGLILSIVFGGAAFFLPEQILRIFSTDSVVIDLGSRYIKIVSISYFLTAISFSYSFASRSIGHAKLPMMVSAISLGINTLFNYVLIFGNLGFPELKIIGAAIATLTARAVELTLLLFIIYRSGNVLAAKVKELFDFSYDFIKKFFNTTLPVILNEGFWSLGVTMYSIAYARISTDAIASVQIATTVQNVFMVIGRGLASACAVMIGNKIGANEEPEAVNYSKRFAIISTVLGIILGCLLFLSSHMILGLFNISQQVYINAQKILWIMALIMGAKMFNLILIVGILRSGGDTKFSLFLEAGSVWIVGVPMAFIGAHLLKLPIHWVVLMVSSEEIVKALIGIPRVISKKWVKNVVKDL